MTMRTCGSCGRGLGVAFAQSPTCPCCGGPIVVRGSKGAAPPLGTAALPEALPADFVANLHRMLERLGEASAPATEAASPPPPSSNDDRINRTQYIGGDWPTPGSLPSIPALPDAAAAEAAPVVEPTTSTPPSGSADPAPAPMASFEPTEIRRAAPADDGSKTHDNIQATILFTPGGSPQVDEIRPPAEQIGPSSAGGPASEPPSAAPPGTGTTGEIAATYDSGSFPPFDAAQFPPGSPNWSGTITGSGPKRQTIRSGERVETDSSLIVNRRLLAHLGASASDDADYQLLQLIGEGGIGVVYAARQASIDRTVAIKMLKSADTSDSQRGKFLTEAVITGELDHPNIVPIYDLAANQQGALFYSMKRVRGTPWNKVLGQRSLTENIEILMKTADAVAFAHSRHVVHRDLKPENVMLGDYGEVLLMDWGLAVSGVGGPKRGPQSHDPGMGGTPAYMSPEMAVGPLERIDARSDVYLLGAILYEIVTGKPPHHGANVMACLFAAAQNQIVPTDRDDELVKIARTAMATQPADRYQSVKDFQTAIRDYQSHAESVLLSVRAEENLNRGRNTGDYQDFSRAVFGFQQALELWQGNDQARNGIVVAQAEYAESALQKGDIDLASSLLNPAEDRHDGLRERVDAARRERDQRQQRLTAAKRLALGLAALVVIVVGGAFVQIRRDRDRAIAAEEAALSDRRIAVSAEREAQQAANLANAEAQKARNAEMLAKQESERARSAEQKARDAEGQALAAAKAAQEARENESYEAYVARIGLAGAKIEENSFDTALQLLDACETRHRRWEWGRLSYLCGRNVGSFAAPGPVDAVSLSPDGRRVAVATWQNQAKVWNLDGTGEPIVVPYNSQYVHAVAFSPDGRRLALGGSDRQAFAVVCEIDGGRVVQKFAGHTDGVLSVAFSADGKRLLTSSYDGTARLWDVDSGRELQRFEGHNWWVWSAAFAPPAGSEAETRVVTAGQDGLVMVWDVKSGEAGPPFRGHRGPVYSAQFSPDGKTVVSAGGDRRLLHWDPATIKPFDFANLLDERPQETQKFTALDGHTAAVRSVAFSADGKRLVSGGNDNCVRVWDVATHTLLKTLRGHAGWVRAAQFVDGAGGRVVSGSHDRRALLWDVERYEEQRVIGHRVLQGHSDAVLAAEFSADDARLVTAGRDHTARLWDVEHGTTLGQLVEGHSFLASQAEFFPALPEFAEKYPAGRIVTAGVDNTARIWDVARGVEIGRLEPAGRASAVAVSHDGKRLITGDDRNGAVLWDAAGQVLFRLEAGGDEVVCVAFSPDDAVAVTGESSGTLRVWNTADGKLVRSLTVHRDRITGIAFAGANRMLTASADNTVAQWDVAAGRELPPLAFKHPDAVTSLAVDAAGKVALTGCSDGQVRVWNIADGQPLGVLFSGDSAPMVVLAHDGRRALVIDPVRRTVRMWDVAARRELPPPQAAAGDAAGANAAAGPAPFLDLASRGELVWTARFSNDDDHILTIGGDGAKLWSVADGAEVRQFSPHGAVAAVDFTSDGLRVATGGWDHSVKIWNTATGRAELKLEGVHTGNINAVDFAPDGRTILSASDDGTVRLCDATTGEPREIVLAHRGPVYAARYDAAGRRILTGGEDKIARIWDAATGKLLVELSGHVWAVHAVAFSPDGTLAATAGADNKAIIWNIATGKPLAELTGHTAGVTSVAFTADSRRLLTGAQDNLAKLWDARTGKEILTLKGHTEEITCVRFSHNDRYALTTSRDGTAVLWPAVEWGTEDEGAKALAPDAETPQNKAAR
jgi:WD40 repeat protein/serine/threonine protein kinase